MNIKKEFKTFHLPSFYFIPSMINVFIFRIQNFSFCINCSCNVYFTLLTLIHLFVVNVFCMLVKFLSCFLKNLNIVLDFYPLPIFCAYFIWCWRLSLLFKHTVCCKCHFFSLHFGKSRHSSDEQIAKKVSEYFKSIPILNIPNNQYKCPDSSEQDLALKILDKYKDHPIIKLIKAKNNSQLFKFGQIIIEEDKKYF